MSKAGVRKMTSATPSMYGATISTDSAKRATSEWMDTPLILCMRATLRVVDERCGWRTDGAGGGRPMRVADGVALRMPLWFGWLCLAPV